MSIFKENMKMCCEQNVQNNVGETRYGNLTNPVSITSLKKVGNLQWQK